MFSFFLAKRFFKSETDTVRQKRASRPAIRIATWGISVGLAVMIISLCFVEGFQNEIRKKLTGFTSHIEILDMKSFSSPESYPITCQPSFMADIRSLPECQQVQRTSKKIGVLKTANDFAGVALKGIGQEYDTSFLKQYIIEGSLPVLTDRQSSNAIVISRTLAEMLHLKVGDRVYCYFFSDTIKQRRFRIAAIYDTHMPQFDKMMVWTDLYTVNKLNDWQLKECSSLEIQLRSFDEIDQACVALNRLNAAQRVQTESSTSILSIKENPQTASILSWLELLDFNVLIILIIMIGVSSFMMVSGLLILILERTASIGILKTLGSTNKQIQQTFLWFAMLIILKGMCWGNLIGVGVVFLQNQFRFFRLDPEVYYINYVPVEFDVTGMLLINAVCLLVIMLTLLVPSLFVSRIEPAKSIRFD